MAALPAYSLRRRSGSLVISAPAFVEAKPFLGGASMQ
jgi:hypothetical protein